MSTKSRIRLSFTFKMDEEESRVLFSSFIDHIRQKLDNEPEVIRIIVKRFNKASASFVHSKEFKNLMEMTISNIDTSPGQKYIYLKEFTDELKAYEQGKNKKKRELSPDGKELNQLAKKAKIDQEEKEQQAQKNAEKRTENVDKPSQKLSPKTKDKTLPKEEISNHSNDKSTLENHKDNDDIKKVQENDAKCDKPKSSPSRTAEKSSNGKIGDAPKRENDDDEKARRGSKKQIMKLEKLLKEIHEEIQKIQEQDMTLDELDDEASLYILEDRYKKKMMKVWNKLCELKGRDSGTGRVTEKRFVYEGTQYNEINRKVSAFINKKKIFPDFNDVQDIIHSCNNRYDLKMRRKGLETLAKQVFVEIGNKLQERREMDFVNNFGCPLTDGFREYDDPALFDRDLSRKLEHNKDVGKSKLEEIINKYAHKQDQGEEEEEEDSDEENEGGEEEEEGSKQIDEEVTQEVEMEMKQAEKEDEKSLQVEHQVIEESETSEDEVEDVDDASSVDEPILKDDYVVDGLQVTLNDTSPDSADLELGEKEEEEGVEILDSSSGEEEEEEMQRKTQAWQDCSRLVPEKPKDNETVKQQVPSVKVANNKAQAIPAPVEEIVTLSDDDDDCNIVTPPPVRLKSATQSVSSTPLPISSASNPSIMPASLGPNNVSGMTVTTNKPVVAPQGMTGVPVVAQQISSAVIPITSPQKSITPVGLQLGPIVQNVVSMATTQVSPNAVSLAPLSSSSVPSVVPIGTPRKATGGLLLGAPTSSNTSSSPRVLMKRCSVSLASSSNASPNKSQVTNIANSSGNSCTNTSGIENGNYSSSAPDIPSGKAKVTVEKTNDYLRRIAGALTAKPVASGEDDDDDDDDVITLDDPVESNEDNFEQNNKHLGAAIRSKLNFKPNKEFLKNIASKAVERIVKNTLRADSPVINICDTPSQDSSQNSALDDIVILD